MKRFLQNTGGCVEKNLAYFSTKKIKDYKGVKVLLKFMHKEF